MNSKQQLRAAAESAEVYQYILFKLVKDGKLTIKELADVFEQSPRQSSFLSTSSELFKNLLEHDLLTTEDFSQLVQTFSTDDFRLFFSSNEMDVAVSLISKFAESLRNFSQERKNDFYDMLFLLDCKTPVVRTTLNNDVFSHHDVKNSLLRVSKLSDVEKICSSRPLMHYLMTRNLLDFALLKRFNLILERSWCPTNNFFELLKLKSKSSVLLNQAEAYQVLMHFKQLTNEETQALLRIAQNSDAARKRLHEIIDNRLEEAFETFDSLKSFIEKPTRRTSINI